MNIAEVKHFYEDISKEFSKVIIGKQDVLKLLVVTLLASGHALIEGVPGIAKTLIAKVFAQTLGLSFKRIQFTPDMIPSDILGIFVYNQKTQEFSFRKGPVFANLVLADEINRGTPKVQSSLLEVMQERQVTIEGATQHVPEPFMVIATQNPIEHEGSLALSEPVFVNGSLETGKELLEKVGGNCIAEDGRGIRLYDIMAWTYALNTSGKIEQRECLLYSVPYAEKMLTIATRTGRKVTVTKNHPFLANEKGVIRWKKACELREGDYLVQPARIPEIPPVRIMSHEEALSKMSQKPVPTEIPVDEDLAFWIAFVLSDGSIGEKYIEVVQKNYPSALDRFVEITRRYGFRPHVFTRGGCRYARFYSKPFVEYLKIRFGVHGGKDKEIPSWFISLPQNLNREFLKTFISLESSLRDNRIVLTQKSARNMNTISYMLLREGIVSWVRYDGRVFRLKIQGSDAVIFLKTIGWIELERTSEIDLERKIKSVFRVVPINRELLISLVKLLGINSFHTLKGRKKITARDWYGSYKNVKYSRREVFTVEGLRKMVRDVRSEILARRSSHFMRQLDENPRTFAASIGLPITEIARKLGISKNQVWNLYTKRRCIEAKRIEEFLLHQYSVRVAKAEKMLRYFEHLLSEDVFYDRVKSIDEKNSDGSAFGLTVPILQNYVAGFGGCGFSHNTYPLPEAQLDRFMCRIMVDYPDHLEGVRILESSPERESVLAGIKSRASTKDLLDAVSTIRSQVHVDKDIIDYIVAVVEATRKDTSRLILGASPRASVQLLDSSKVLAAIQGRNFVIPDDVKELCFALLNHRVILRPDYLIESLSGDRSPHSKIRKVVEDALTEIMPPR